MYVTSGEKGGYDANFIVEYLVIMWLQKRRKVDTWEVGGRRVPWREITVKKQSCKDMIINFTSNMYRNVKP